MIAARMGRYQPEAVLGQAALTVTYRARALERLPAVDSRDFTLKVLRRDQRRPELDERFLTAARALQWTSPAGTANVVEVIESGDIVGAAFEFKEGVDLRHLRTSAVKPGERMDARLVGLVGRKLAERLKPLHAQADGPSTHGCLSPGNVLVRPSGELLLLDCGLSEALRTRKTWPSESWHFAAPEQLRGEPATSSSDLYSVGALMYFLYCGKAPHQAETPAELLAQLLKGPPLLADLHPAIAACMARLLSPDPAARPKSAVDAARQISVALLSVNAGFAAPPPAAPAVAPVPASRPQASPAEAELAELPSEALAPLSAADDASEAASASAGPEPETADPNERPSQHEHIAADDPDVGAVFDDDDEEDVVEVGPDGTVRRRRRRRAIRLLAWTRSAFARKIFRYAWAPAAVILVVGGIQGYFFMKSWREARAESARKDAEHAAAQAKIEAVKPKLVKAPSVPVGHLVVNVNPAGAIIWIDGKEVGRTPTTLLTEPQSHRIVITAPGYRMLRDVVDASHGAVFEHDMVPAIFPSGGSVGVNVSCTTEGRYPVFIDGKDIGANCPIAGVRLSPGRHMVGLFVIPENRIWTYDREIVADHPHRVQFNY